MSGTDPFFDAWVRDKLLHTEARTPEHLWETIRKRSRDYVIMERNKYFLILLLLLGSTAGTGYWIFRPTLQSGLVATKATGGAASAHAQAEEAQEVQEVQGVQGVQGDAAASDAKASLYSAPTINDGTPRIGESPAQGKESPLTGQSISTGQSVSANQPIATGQPTPAVTGSMLGIAPPTANLRDNLEAIAPFALIPAQPQTDNRLAGTVSAPHLIHVRPASHAYFQVYGGPDHVTHYITSSAHAYNGFVTQMRDAIQSYPSFSLGVRMDLPLAGENWRLQMGLHYAQINEKMTYSNFNASKMETEVSTRSISQPGGGTVTLHDTATVLVKGQILKQSLNAYRMFDIPVLISHTVIRTGQVQVNGSAGAMFNVTSWYNGDILDTTGLPMVIDAKTTSQGTGAWKKHIGTSLYGSLSLYDQVFNRVQVTFEPYLRYDLSPINRDVSVYKQRFVTTGLMLGIRYQLGK